MATTRYFSDLGGTVTEVSFWGGMDNAQFAAKFPGVRGWRMDSFARYVGRDAAGNFLPITRATRNCPCW